MSAGGQPVLTRVPGEEPVVALTFDDGPDPRFTPEVLSVLVSAGVPATFFVVGEHVASHPDVVAALRDAGVGVGVHSWDHADLDAAGPAVARRQLGRTIDELARHGVVPTLFRPPYGRGNDDTVATAAELGLRTVLWSVDTLDWMDPSAEEMLACLALDLHPGAIVLLHDGGGDRTETVRALPEVIRLVADAGFAFVDLAAAL